MSQRGYNNIHELMILSKSFQYQAFNGRSCGDFTLRYSLTLSTQRETVLLKIRKMFSAKPLFDYISERFGLSFHLL